MECQGDFIEVGGKVCLGHDTNPYIRPVTELFVRIDEGLRWNRNFKHFGAANAQKMTGEEVLALLETSNDIDVANAIAAIIAVLQDTGHYRKGLQKYCIGHKFRTNKLEDFVDWSDVEVSSDKLGWPVAP